MNKEQLNFRSKNIIVIMYSEFDSDTMNKLSKEVKKL